MKPSKLYEALHALIGERVPLHIWGACGVGKSQIVAQVARDLGIAFLDVRAVQLDPVDLRGLPRIKADQTEWVPPKFLPNEGKGILFLDELTSAPQIGPEPHIRQSGRNHRPIKDIPCKWSIQSLWIPRDRERLLSCNACKYRA